jgi:poly(3-hydroxybutyrate) depolymerase
MCYRMHCLVSTLIAVFLSFQPSIGQTSPNDSILVDGKYRIFVVHAPTGLPAHPPLVLVIHGYKMSGSLMESYSQFDKVADREKFVAVYPEAIDKNWDMSGGTDVPFLLALVDTIVNRYSIDRNRIYSCGFSQGGFMSHLLGATHADIFAAIGPVSGGLGSRNIKPARPLPVMHIHGADDTLADYSSIVSTIKTWVEKDGCPQTPVTTKPYPPTKADSKVVKDYYGPCNQNSEVILLTLGGVGHAWATGGSKYDISAPEELWAFFKNHSLNAGVSVSGFSPASSPRLASSARYERGAIRIFTTEQVDRVQCMNISGRIIGQWSHGTFEPNHEQGAFFITTKLSTGLFLISCFGKSERTGVTTVSLFVP